MNDETPTSIPNTADDRSSVGLDRVRSRQRAVSRVFKGYVTAATGLVGLLVTTPVIESVLGASQSVERVWSIGARSLVWIGFLIAASAVTHLRRFGGRRGVLAFASFAAAGACGLLATAEQFESWFLNTHVLHGLDIWGLAGVLFFGVLGAVLLRGDPPRWFSAASGV